MNNNADNTTSLPLWRPTNMATEDEDVILPISPALFRSRTHPSAPAPATPGRPPSAAPPSARVTRSKVPRPSSSPSAAAAAKPVSTTPPATVPLSRSPVPALASARQQPAGARRGREIAQRKARTRQDDLIEQQQQQQPQKRSADAPGEEHNENHPDVWAPSKNAQPVPPPEPKAPAKSKAKSKSKPKPIKVSSTMPASTTRSQLPAQRRMRSTPMMEITNMNKNPADVHVHANAKPLSSSLVGQNQGKGTKGQAQRHEATKNYSVKARKRKRTETQHNIGRRPNDNGHGAAGQQVTRARETAAAMSPSRLSEAESLSDSDGHHRRRPTTVANKWETSRNRRPANNPLRTSLSSALSPRSRLSLSSESSPELLRHAGLLSPSRASTQADVHAANSRNDDALLPSPSLFDVLDNSENAKPAVTTAVRTYSKKSKKQRTVMGSASTPGLRPSIGGQVLKEVSSGRVVFVSLPSTKALGIRSSSPSHPSPGTTSTGVHDDDDKNNDDDEDDDDYEEEEEENTSDDQDDGNNKGSGLGRDDQAGDNSNASRSQSKTSDFLQAFYMSQRQLWKEVDEISLEEELVG